MRTTKREISARRGAFVALVAAAALGCTDVGGENEPPVAAIDVWVAGTLVEGPISFMGSPVTLTLDGTGSMDADGRLVRFTWLQTDVAPAVRYSIPSDGGVPPTFTGDPPPGPMTQVLFNAPGTAEYSLWVTDDDDTVSEPATVALEVATPFMPDAACLAAYLNPNPTCAECICTPNAMMGCLDEYTACYANADAAFVALCKAVIECGLEAGCKGQGCYTGGCMTQIDAAAAHMGGTLADCSMGDPAVNPCAAATRLGACTNDTTCMASCL